MDLGDGSFLGGGHRVSPIISPWTQEKGGQQGGKCPRLGAGEAGMWLTQI